MRASLAWTLDQKKMRHHLLFGWKTLFAELAQGPVVKRVGVVLPQGGHAGCRVLSNPERRPIGEISSTAWSPALQRRIGMAYVKPEFAKHDLHVQVPLC